MTDYPYEGPARPGGIELQEAEDRVRSALRSNDEREFDARLPELTAAQAARFMPDLSLMDIEAEMTDLGMDPSQWYAEADEPEAGQ